MSIDFNTSAYEFAHGHTPRGRGLWAFAFRTTNADQADMFWANGTYTEAKKLARIEAKRLGRPVVYVCS